MPKKTVKKAVKNAKEIYKSFHSAFIEGKRRENYNKYVKGG